MDGQVNATVNNPFPYYTFDCVAQITGKHLRKAVLEALPHHPVFRTKLEKHGNSFYIVPTDAEPIVKEHDLNVPIVYETKEYNENPWLLTYSEKTVIFTCAHKKTLS